MNAIAPYAACIHVCMKGVRVPLIFSSYSFSHNKSIYDNNMLYYQGFHSNYYQNNNNNYTITVD